MKPLLSIVTVSMNAASTIEDTLRSVALQRLDFPLEHVCVDGGSRDATRATIDRFAGDHDHVRRIYESDRGIFDAMNKGLAAATGEYVLFLNADDFLVSADVLAAALGDLRSADPGNPDLIVGDVAMGVPGRVGIWRHRRVPRLLGRIRGLGLFPVHQGLFAKRSLLRAAGGFDAAQRLGADVALYYDIESRMRPSIRRIGADVVFMRSGGAANAGVAAMVRGSAEILAYVARRRGLGRALLMVAVKTLQSVSELRFGRCPHARWFATAPRASPAGSA